MIYAVKVKGTSSTDGRMHRDEKSVAKSQMVNCNPDFTKFVSDVSSASQAPEPKAHVPCYCRYVVVAFRAYPNTARDVILHKNVTQKQPGRV